MSLTKYTASTAIIAALSDLPNATDGLTAAQLKAKFDENPEAFKTFVNSLIDQLESTTDSSSGADQIGATSITDLTGNTVQALLESLKALFDSQLPAPDGSITNTKLATDVKVGSLAALTTTDKSSVVAAFNEHLAEVTSYLVVAARDISLEGNQTIALIGGRIPKKITISALVGGSVHASWGAVASNNQGGMAQIDTGNMTVFSSVGVFIRQSSVNFISGAVLMETGQITITWAKTGTPTGTANLIITADYHD